MNFKFSNVVMFLTFFAMLFYTFVLLFSGSNFFNTNPFPSFNNLTIPQMYSQLQTLLGGQWSIFGFSVNGFENAIIYGLMPIAFVANIIYDIGSVMIWIVNLIYYPFSLLPQPFNTVIPIVLSIMVAISILTSIRIMESGIE
jgi:hypothetical protein